MWRVMRRRRASRASSLGEKFFILGRVSYGIYNLRDVSWLSLCEVTEGDRRANSSDRFL